MHGDDGSNIRKFPPKIAERSLDRKLAVRRQSAATTEWIDWLISVDLKVVQGAAELGMSEAEFRPFVHAALKRKGQWR
jgi:hypothetical protein